MEDKLDLILRRIEEYERRRVEADQRRSADLLSLKVAVESWMPGIQKKDEHLQFLVGDEQCKVTPTPCSTECPNGGNPSTTERFIYIDEGTTLTGVLELGNGEDKVHDPYITTKDFPEVTLTTCSVKCSIPDIEPNLTMVEEVTYASTDTTSMELVVDKNTTRITYINTPDYPKVTHTKCSTLGLDVKGSAYHSRVTCQTMMGVPEGVLGPDASSEVFSPWLMAVLNQYTSMPIRCLLKCPNGDKRPLMEHPKRNRWPPPTQNHSLVKGHVLQLTLSILQCLGVRQQWMQPWLPLIGVIQEHICEQEHIMYRHWDPDATLLLFSMAQLPKEKSSQGLHAGATDGHDKCFSGRKIGQNMQGCPLKNYLQGIAHIKNLGCAFLTNGITRDDQAKVVQETKLRAMAVSLNAWGRCGYPKEIKELHVPWDTGGVFHRLGDKPNFKKRGLIQGGPHKGWLAHRHEAQAEQKGAAYKAATLATLGHRTDRSFWPRRRTAAAATWGRACLLVELYHPLPLLLHPALHPSF
uniref:Uncharacterized protein n=1 Tax=Oryza glumipatula TaxID=40148 RepID=A0A0E0AKE7_9ORYZ